MKENHDGKIAYASNIYAHCKLQQQLEGLNL